MLPISVSPKSTEKPKSIHFCLQLSWMQPLHCTIDWEHSLRGILVVDAATVSLKSLFSCLVHHHHILLPLFLLGAARLVLVLCGGSFRVLPAALGDGVSGHRGAEACVLVSAVSLQDKMVSFEMNDLKKIGLGLTGFGIFFSFLGIVFFFDKGLIAMGNILFLSGLGLTIGLKSTMQFFTKPKNYKGTISFGAGFFLVLIGWPFFGMLLEAYGFIVLFSGFWPTLAVFLQRIPIIGWIFQQPFVTSFLDRYRGKRVPV
ncbi:unnamed protein product [Miscanthus lutarioriparius]|uniref:Uncharacterized protein n=1 Tax=Miscanthus lutarioriparius TaxID=422564 RepID=A0A811MSS4_9POAL|nr:unnamed protein product [Miscanthus lutarioriparius]